MTTPKTMSEKEIWKEIPGYFGKYEASSKGRIRSLFIINRSANKKRLNPLILSQSSGYNNYKIVQLSIGNKRSTQLVHRLVLLSFIVKNHSSQQCSHIDGNSENNNINNLEWASASKNILMKNIHGTVLNGEKNLQSKLKEIEVIKICKRIINGHSFSSISKDYCVHQNTIRSISNKRLWKYLTDKHFGLKNIRELRGIE
jgi:hypothetical protein